jgi:lysine-specific demethylase 8
VAVAASPPSLTEFAATTLNAAPLLLPGCVAHWPALTRWASPAALAAIIGDRTVPVEVGAHYLAPGWGQKMVKGGDFLSACVAAAAAPASAAPAPPTPYLAQHDRLAQVPALQADITVPDYCALGGGSGGEEGDDGGPAINVWVGPPATLSPLHTDPASNLLCQAVGRKYVRLYPPGTNVGADGGREGDAAGAAALATNSSPADPYSLAPAPAAPGLAGAPFLDVVLHPGDALYVPPRWWHWVLALDASACVSFWF